MGKKVYGFIRGIINWPTRFFFPVKMVGKENMPKENKVITVSNHFSFLDIPILAVRVKGYRHFIGKKELGRNKFIHWFGLKTGIIFIDRGKADLNAMRQIFGALKNDEGLSIFPEGTRNKSGTTELQDVKSGACLFAVKGNAPIVPIVFYKKAKIFSKNYIYIAKPFSLDEFKPPLTGVNLEKATNILAEHMEKAKEYLDDYVINKRWKEEKKAKKEEKRALKFFNKEAKQAKKQAVKSLKAL